MARRLFPQEGLVGVTEAVYGIAATIAVDSLADIDESDSFIIQVGNKVRLLRAAQT